MSKYEKRFFKGMELRLAEGDDWPLSGYIAEFNQLSEDFGGWREKIEPGAFKDSIGRDDIRGLWNHENDLVLGRLSAGTLELEEDEKGLAFRNKPPDTSWFKDRAVSLRRKDVTGASFGFFVDPGGDEWQFMPDGSAIRTLKRVTLVEVSPGCTFPAYPQPEVELNAARRCFEARKLEFEQLAAGQPAAIPATVLFRQRELELIELGSKFQSSR